jgi:hypothetical protein
MMKMHFHGKSCIINDIVRTYGPDYLLQYAKTMPMEHRKVINASERSMSTAAAVLRGQTADK